MASDTASLLQPAACLVEGLMPNLESLPELTIVERFVGEKRGDPFGQGHGIRVWTEGSRPAA